MPLSMASSPTPTSGIAGSTFGRGPTLDGCVTLGGSLPLDLPWSPLYRSLPLDLSRSPFHRGLPFDLSRSSFHWGSLHRSSIDTRSPLHRLSRISRRGSVDAGRDLSFPNRSLTDCTVTRRSPILPACGIHHRVRSRGHPFPSRTFVTLPTFNRVLTNLGLARCGCIVSIVGFGSLRSVGPVGSPSLFQGLTSAISD